MDAQKRGDAGDGQEEMEMGVDPFGLEDKFAEPMWPADAEAVCFCRQETLSKPENAVHHDEVGYRSTHMISIIACTINVTIYHHFLPVT